MTRKLKNSAISFFTKYIIFSLLNKSKLQLLNEFVKSGANQYVTKKMCKPLNGGYRNILWY